MAVELNTGFDFLSSNGALYYPQGIAASVDGAATITSAAARTGPNGVSFTNTAALHFSLGSVATRYFAVGWRCATMPVGNSPIIRWWDGVILHMQLEATASGHFRMARGDGTVLAQTTGAQVFFQNVFYHLQGAMTINNTTGAFEIKLNGVSLAALTASGVDTQNGGAATTDRFSILGSSGGSHFDDLHVNNASGAINNTFPGDVAVRAYAATGNGFHTAWTGAFTDVDEMTDPDEDTTKIESSTPGNKETFTFGATAAGNTIICVTQRARIKKTDAGARTARLLIRSGGADFESADITVDNSYIYKNQIQETDPNTAAAWTLANRNAAEFGMKDQA